MSVDIAELVPSLKREIYAPGETVPVSVSEEEWVGHLTDAFWEARLHGLLKGYTVDGGLIQPIAVGAPDLSRDMQQLVVLYAGFRLALTSFRNVNSSYRAKAGPVEYEVQKSAQTLKSLLDAIKSRIDFILKNLSEYDADATSVAVFDGVLNNTYSGALGSWYVGG